MSLNDGRVWYPLFSSVGDEILLAVPDSRKKGFDWECVACPTGAVAPFASKDISGAVKMLLCFIGERSPLAGAEGVLWKLA
jgi:hypothetical protein